MGWSFAFWLLLFIFIVFLLILIISWAVYAFTTPKGYDSLFRFMNVSLNHLGTTSINIIVHNRLKTNYQTAKTPLATSLRGALEAEIAKLDAGDPWETVARRLGEVIYDNYDVVGTSVEILLPTADTGVSTATFTKGYVPAVLKLDAVDT